MAAAPRTMSSTCSVASPSPVARQVTLALRAEAAADTDGARLVWAGRSAARIGIAQWGGSAYMFGTLAPSAWQRGRTGLFPRQRKGWGGLPARSRGGAALPLPEQFSLADIDVREGSGGVHLPRAAVRGALQVHDERRLRVSLGGSGRIAADQEDATADIKD